MPIDGGGRADRPRRPLQPRPAEHPDRRRTGVRRRRRPISRSCGSSATSCGAAASACSSPAGRWRRAAPATTRPSASTGRSGSSPTWRSTPTGRGPTPTGCPGDDTSYRGQLDYNGDRYGVQLEHLRRRRQLQPGGRVRAAQRHAADASARCASVRVRARSVVRRFSWTGIVAYIENSGGPPRHARAGGEFAIEFQNSDRFTSRLPRHYEFLPTPFAIAPGRDAAGRRLRLRQRPRRVQPGSSSASSRATCPAEHGTFYNGHKTALSASRGRVNFGPQLSVEPTYSVNWVDLRQGRSRRIWSARA